MNIQKLCVAISLSTVLTSGSVYANGFLRDILQDTGVINQEQGDVIDGANGKIKDALPVYRSFDEAAAQYGREHALELLQAGAIVISSM